MMTYVTKANVRVDGTRPNASDVYFRSTPFEDVATTMPQSRQTFGVRVTTVTDRVVQQTRIPVTTSSNRQSDQ